MIPDEDWNLSKNQYFHSNVWFSEDQRRLLPWTSERLTPTRVSGEAKDGVDFITTVTAMSQETPRTDGTSRHLPTGRQTISSLVAEASPHWLDSLPSRTSLGLVQKLRSRFKAKKSSSLFCFGSSCIFSWTYFLGALQLCKVTWQLCLDRMWICSLVPRHRVTEELTERIVSSFEQIRVYFTLLSSNNYSTNAFVFLF